MAEVFYGGLFGQMDGLALQLVQHQGASFPKRAVCQIPRDEIRELQEGVTNLAGKQHNLARKEHQALHGPEKIDPSLLVFFWES